MIKLNDKISRLQIILVIITQLNGYLQDRFQ